VKTRLRQYGFVHQENLIMACIGGSQAHGAKTGRYRRYRLVWTLTFRHRLNFLGSNVRKHFVSRPGANSEATDPLDVDVCLYTLMKWAGLAAKAIHRLYISCSRRLSSRPTRGNHFSARPELFLAKGHVKPFLGFADDQMKRLLGQKGQKKRSSR